MRRFSRRSFAQAVSAGALLSSVPKEVRATSEGEVSTPINPFYGASGDVRAMRVLITPRDLSDDSLRFAKQIGVEDVTLSPYSIPEYKQVGYLDLDTARRLKRHVESFGLRAGTFYLGQFELNDVLLDKPGWNAALDRVCRTIECLGKVSIPMMQFSLLTSRAILSSENKPGPSVDRPQLPGYWTNPNGRGGARLHSFDGEKADLVRERPDGAVSADQMWERIRRFQERCVPVATEAKVYLACHPDDPPVPHYWGVTQVLNTVENLNRLLDIVPSEYNGLLLCQGTIQEAGIDVPAFIRNFGKRRKIFFVEVRGVRGNMFKYDEVFLDEGELQLRQVVQALKDVGYRGYVEPQHLPEITGDDAGQQISTAWHVGFVKGVLSAS